MQCICFASVHVLFFSFVGFCLDFTGWRAEHVLAPTGRPTRAMRPMHAEISVLRHDGAGGQAMRVRRVSSIFFLAALCAPPLPRAKSPFRLPAYCTLPMRFGRQAGCISLPGVSAGFLRVSAVSAAGRQAVLSVYRSAPCACTASGRFAFSQLLAGKNMLPPCPVRRVAAQTRWTTEAACRSCWARPKEAP